jgi:hypothetical protein
MRKWAWMTCASALLASAALAEAPATGDYRQSPAWTKDLVVYEIATKGFTSPNGPDSGNFNSMRERLDHLQQLGVTGIWLTGYNPAAPRHFYNVWNQYAVIEPDQIDPSLGTPEDFKAFVDAAHARGIKVFLDVITHGLMPESSVVKNHPDWFRGGSWGMVDFDWQGGHLDLDDWWVKTYSDYVTKFGVDGFRLDLAIHRADLWARIRKTAFDAGHPIVVFIELEPVIPGVTDFTQRNDIIQNTRTGKVDELAVMDIPAVFARKNIKYSGNYVVSIQYDDGSEVKGSSAQPRDINVRYDGFTRNRTALTPLRPDGRSEVQLTIDRAKPGRIKSGTVVLLDAAGAEVQKWNYVPYVHTVPNGEFAVVGNGAQQAIYLSSIQSESASVQISSHDNGWEGSGTGNPYTVKGSRALLGYAGLFTPRIPIMMSGEEFDAGYHALPSLSPFLFGGAQPGQGRWLYGNQIDWSELKQPAHAAMFEDASRMLQIRKAESAILQADLDSLQEKRLVAVPYTSDVAVPKPYFRWTGREGIVVLANRDTGRNASITLDIPVDKLGTSSGRYRVTDLWHGGKARVMSAADLHAFKISVGRDRVRRGGLGLIKVAAID